MSNTTRLLIEKLVMAFLVAFFGALLTSLEGLSKQPDFGWNKSLIIAVIVGALGAGIRAVLALSPINIVSSDSLHTLGA